MRVANRVQKLERSGAFKGAATIFTRYEEALQDAAYRVTGRAVDWNRVDDEVRRRIDEDVNSSFIRKLSTEELEALVEEMDRIASGGSVAV